MTTRQWLGIANAFGMIVLGMVTCGTGHWFGIVETLVGAGFLAVWLVLMEKEDKP